MKPEDEKKRYDDMPILHSFTGPFDEEHIQAFLAEHINLDEIATVAITSVENRDPHDKKRDPDARRPEIVATVSGTSLGQSVESTYSIYSEYELRKLVADFMDGDTLPEDATPKILHQLTTNTLSTLNRKTEQLVNGRPIEVVVRFSRPPGPRVGNPLVPFPVPSPSGNNLN